ncbi:MAG: RNA polymerase sporulation sigma factor SigH [Clostridia bacterium]|nr:RNA polymerase sporulation sigma factor SigH [Clostridia bacterium]
MSEKVLGSVCSEANDQDKIDREYICKIKAGDKSALNYIMEKYKNFVYVKAKPFFMVGAEKDDIIQEGMIGLYKAINGFDEEKDVSFKVFADLCIRRQIMTAIKASTRQKHIPLNSYLSLNKTVFDDDSDREVIEMLDMEIVPDPLDTITTHETYQKVEETMNKVLSDFELKVLNEYVNGASYVEIANKLDSHVKAVDNAVQRIKKKVDKHLADEKF